MNILVWPGVKYKAQYFLRHLWPAQQLMKMGYDVRIVDPRTIHEFSESEDVMTDIFMWADLVVTFFPKTRTGLKLLETCNEFDKRFVVDVDDFVFSVDPSNPAYKGSGLRDAYTDTRPHWVNGINYNRDANQKRYIEWLTVMENTDTLTVTQSVLGDLYAPFTPDPSNIWVLPNSLDLSYYKPWDHEARDTVRIGWQGGASHLKDLKLIESPLREIMDKYPEVQLVWMGQGWPYFDRKFPEMEFHPWVDSDTYYLKLGELDLDIGLCPLEETLFNIGKSNLKQIEYGAYSVPSVVSIFKNSPYGPPHGMDVGEYQQVSGCLTVDNSSDRSETEVEQDWFNAMETLVVDAKTRKELGRAAREYVDENFNIEHNARYWAACYEATGQRIITKDIRGKPGENPAHGKQQGVEVDGFHRSP